jgi:RNA polymerase sigma-70 factor, ECF subfamily
MLQSDHDIVLKIKQGDETAFNSLFYQYHGRVFNLCRKFLSRKEDAEEVVQTVFLAVWENRNQLDENQPIIAYILTITKHWIYNFLKKRVYRKAFLDYLETRNDSLDFVTEDEISYHDLQNLLEKLMEEMPPKRKEIFHLSKIEGLSYREISQRLSITESTVNTQITKALEYIRKQVEILY